MHASSILHHDLLGWLGSRQESPMALSSKAAPPLTSAAVFQQYQDRIYRYILRLVRDEGEAEDLTQETFLRAHRQLDALQDAAALTVWLYRIATHVCYDRFRQASYRHPAKSLDVTAEESPDSGDGQYADTRGPRLDQVIEQGEMSACVQGFLEELSDDYRMVVLLHDLHEMTNPEIVQMLGCSLETVKIRLHRARRKLKAALAARCELSHDERGVLVCDRKPSSQ
jgi:RNA polymerase sigma-70 factor, ECF subfamily